jgi:hypothetical protein
MHQRSTFFVSACLCLTTMSLATPGHAAHPREVWTPMASPRASVAQEVGVTRIEVDYSRPAVRGREVWGKLVPWGEVWRAGADLNTRLAVSTDVTVAGKPLPAGTYGLHIIPAESGPWTLILSRDAEAWGSYAYDSNRDALRVELTPTKADHVEDLRYGFDRLTPDGVALVLQWEKLALEVPIGIDRVATVRADLERQLTGLPQFYPQSWADAATWAIDNGQLELADGWVARSLSIQETFGGRLAESRLRTAQGRADDAATARRQALALGDLNELHQLGRTLIRAGQKAEALEVFQANATKHPDSWVPLVGLARGLAVNGQLPKAAETMRAAAAKAPADQRQYLDGLAEKLARGEAID